MERIVRHRRGVPLAGALLCLALLCASCGAKQRNETSDSLTGKTPARLASDEKENLRNCVLATAERNYARGNSGNLSATVQAVRNTLEPPGSRQARYRARVRDWNLDWNPDAIETLRVRFGTRGLEIAGLAERPTDAGELYHRLETSGELPELHMRQIRGNDVDGFRFRFVEETIDDLLRRGPDLDTVYARAREMGLEPVLRDVCPAEDNSPERLPPEDRGDWERTIRDLPGAWKFSGYETTATRNDHDGLHTDLYSLSEQQEFWHTVEIVFHDGETSLRIGNLIPDGTYTYRSTDPLPDRLQTLVRTAGVESWAKFDQCPRRLCGLDASEFPHVGEAELNYLAKLIRSIDELRKQLYDIQAAAWMNGPPRSGLSCTHQVFEKYESMQQFSLSFGGKLQVVLDRPPEATQNVEKTLEHCSRHSVARTNGKVHLERADGSETDDSKERGTTRDEPSKSSKPPVVGTRVAADLGTSESLQTAVSDIDPRWSGRDFVDGADQLRFLVKKRKAPAVGKAMEQLRGRFRSLEGRLTSRHTFLDLFTKSLLAPPFSNVDVATLPPVEFGSEVIYHRITLNAEASRTAARQFVTLLRNLQDERLIIAENVRWSGIPTSESENARLVATVGVLSRR